MSQGLFPAFSSFADALMASLASRSYEWGQWEISESRALPPPFSTALFDPLNNHPYEIKLGLRAPNGSHFAATWTPNDDASPSLFLGHCLIKLNSSQSAQPGTQPNPNSQSHLVFLAVDRGLNPSETESLKALLLAGKKLHWMQRKNSQGRYFQEFCTIF